MSDQTENSQTPPIDHHAGDGDGEGEINDDPTVLEIYTEVPIDTSNNNDDNIVNSSTSIGSSNSSAGGGGTTTSDNTSDVSREDSTNTEDSVRTLEAEPDDSPVGEDNIHDLATGNPAFIGPQNRTDT